MMTSSPACTPQIKRGTMPTLGNNNIRTNNKEQVKHVVFSDRGSASKLAPGTNSVKTNNVAIKPFVPTAKLTLDGKVVDIDVLTKLQQQNGGNIVSFTASKEFLSNLASAKIHSSKVTGPPKSRVNKQDVSVFKSLTGKRTQQEKVLLPKNQLNGFAPKSRIEVKKFAPEIKGLLSGLSTAFKTSSAVSINTTKCSRDIQSGGSLQASNVSCKGITERAKKNLLLAVKTTEQITSSTSHTNIASTVGTKPSLLSQVNNIRQPQTSIKKLTWNSLPQTSSVIVPNSARNIARTQSVITSTGSTKVFPFKTPYNHFDLAQSVKHPNQGLEDEKRKRSPTCNIKVKKDNYGYPSDFVNKNNTYESQYHSVKNIKEAVKPAHTFRSVSNEVKGEPRLTIKQEAKTNIFENSNGAQKNKSTIANFTELYENAVRNVLNIKAFSDNFTNVTNTTSYSKQIEKAFDTYLKRPVEFDIKLERFQYSRTRAQDSPSNNHLDGEPFSKRVRSEDKFTNTNSNESKSSSRQESPDDVNTTTNANSSQEKTMEYFKLFDFKRKQEEGKKTTQYENQNKPSEIDNRSFFAQFLSDQTFLSQHQPHSYYSPADFPWLYPSYMYEKYYQAHLPYYYYGDYHAENVSEQATTKAREETEEDKTNKILTQEKVEEKPSPTPNELNTFRMKLNTVASEQTNIIKEEIKEQEPTVSSPPTQDVKKQKCKNKKDAEKIKTTTTTTTTTTTPKESPVQPKKIKIKECLKYRPYSLRQRVKALKKAKKIAHLKPKQPKYVLKDMNAKNLTKKEIFLGYLGLRRILKRNDRKVNEGK